MFTIILIIQIMVTIALVALVLLQRSEGGALGIGGGGGGGGGLMSGRGVANLLTRSTAFLAAAFFATSIALTVIAGSQGETGLEFEETDTPASVIDQLLIETDEAEGSPAVSPEGAVTETEIPVEPPVEEDGPVIPDAD